MTRLLPPTGALAQMKQTEFASRSFGAYGEMFVSQPNEPLPTPEPLRIPPADWRAEELERARLERCERDRLAAAEIAALEDVESRPAQRRPQPNLDRLLTADRADKPLSAGLRPR